MTGTIQTFPLPVKLGVCQVTMPSCAQVESIVSGVYGVHPAVVVCIPGGTPIRMMAREFRIVRDGEATRGGRYVGSFHTPGGGKSIAHVVEVV